jgi:iron complex transport system permease protein
MRHRLPPLVWTLAFLLLAVMLSIAIGSVFIAPSDLWRLLTGNHRGVPLPEPLATYALIIVSIRLPRTVLVALTGAALGASGAAYQGLFRNPLADPYLIGVASIQWPYTFWGLMAIPMAAFIAALLTVFIVYSLARVGRTVPTTNLILAGVAFGSFATALTSFLMLRSSGEVRRALGWLLGGASQAGWMPVLGILPYLVIGLAILMLSGHALNLLQFGDEQAHQLGLPVTRAKTIILVAASLTTAAAVAFAGIIGFVGLIVPHVMRMWFGGDYRRLLPLSLIGGAAALLIADVLARVVLAPQEIPLGIITALAGAPFFLWVLRRSKNQGYW